MSYLFPHRGITDIDGGECWRRWWTLPKRTSLKKVARQFEREGLVNSKTGKPYCGNSIRYHAWSWALKPENQKAAYDVLRQHWAQQGRIITDEDWKFIMTEAAKNIVFKGRKRNLRRFLVQNNLMEYYERLQKMDDVKDYRSPNKKKSQE
jgi:hypothetical protein